MTLVGVQLHPQHCSVAEIRAAWNAADQAGLDSIWTWDHFFPLYGDADGDHFEGWSLLAAMAADTERASSVCSCRATATATPRWRST